MKTVIEMAHEAAIGHPDFDQDDVSPLEGDDLAFYERFADFIRADEREACAKVCDHMASRCNDIRAAALESAAENIKARGNK